MLIDNYGQIYHLDAVERKGVNEVASALASEIRKIGPLWTSELPYFAYTPYEGLVHTGFKRERAAPEYMP